MVRWVIGSIPYGGPLSYSSFQPELHDWCSKRRGRCYPGCGMVHIKDSLMLIGKRNPCSGGSGFPLSLQSGPLTYVRCHINNVLSASYFGTR